MGLEKAGTDAAIQMMHHHLIICRKFTRYKRFSMTHAPVYVRFKGIQKSYDDEHFVVRDLNLDIYKGEFLTLLGPSGSGKTTSLMMLAGFEQPSSGEILVNNKPIHTLPPHQRNIGMVFQNYALFPHMTVAQNLAFPLSVRRLSHSDVKEKVARALDMVRLAHVAERYPAQLSGGQQQRIALARALVFEPKLVLMDEPLGALDKQLREQMQLEIRRLHRDLGLTVVFVTHDQSEALTMSDRVAVFNDGVIQQIDAPQALYERPSNAFVAQFVGENNVLKGVVERRETDWSDVRLPSGSLLSTRTTPATPKLGEQALVSVRPERVEINTSALDAQLPARIVQLIYLGDHVRAQLALDDGGEFAARIPASQMRSEWAAGTNVTVSWRHQDASALDCNS
ncbi:ABC transporter ATP-binding protein [Herbaspirillum sp. DW155]|uniref:ABC transporter ATP-binding protein n=1 Tax=Herbaspirillum sp. DW155 TaxID=3095609 RepID=UPI003086E207|nr:ABC transporter ATP-binding protein [Herbaspirillum sp. DW155]